MAEPCADASVAASWLCMRACVHACVRVHWSEGLCCRELLMLQLPQQVLCVTKGLALCCRFVLENSGVAEPQNIRDKFADAVATGA